MDDQTIMFGSIKENGLDFDSPILSSSTLLNFSPSYFSPTDKFMSCFDPIVSPEESDTHPHPLDDYQEVFDDQLIQAFENLYQGCSVYTDLLVQLWLPVIRHGKQVLTTASKSFIINSDNANLSNYRELSKNYQFAADYDSTEMIGLPSHVFMKKFPTCTPDLRFVAEGDDPRVIYAQKLNLCGCLNLPVFELDGETCLGVVEVVTTSQKVNFPNELKNICKALEAVDLRTSESLIHPNTKEFKEAHDVVIAEIRDVVKTICNTFKLPLAQTWGPCEARSQQHVNSFSVIKSASYVFDPEILSFFEGTSGEQLVPGEGIAGKALGRNQLCFNDINDFCRTDYPISSYYGLNGVISIRLRSTCYTGPTDFILEFFLPRDCKRDEEQKHIRSSIILMIKHVSWSLHLINDEELMNDMNSHDESWISDMVEAQERGETVIVSMECHKEEPEEETNPLGESWMTDMIQAKERGKNVILSIGCHKEEQEEEFKMINQVYNGFGFCELEKETYLEWVTGNGLRGQSKRSSIKSRAKTERNISLQVIQQYFPGSLKDAAKSIGVCPTTLKRICRQHGIMRWPSRKIKKVSHSLEKLQVIIDSVQGADGMIKLGSFYNNFPELNPPISPNPKPKVNNRVNILKESVTPSDSPSSCNHGSSSSSGNVVHNENAHLSQKKMFLRYNNRNALLSTPNKKLVDNEGIPPAPKSPNSIYEDIFRVKATYSDEKIRFRMSKNWGFGDLQREIMRRFNIYDMGNFTIKYIDDDSELVLLACDDDVVECLELHTSTKNQMIKLVVHMSSHPSFMSMVHPNDDIHMW
ncbi:protein NLP2 [Lactuca sativa]|uniref:PB1 domain-containing protein n=1 Tax=Lactuca sativa TaxID=4236 RepID=A0A9R1VSV7_LACSA|nr:protein NLP2 [Lactuca sativa]KAJ0210270.1 hypothetical protein LSAT_V11C400185010 [Lactuca sativa]